MGIPSMTHLLFCRHPGLLTLRGPWQKSCVSSPHFRERMTHSYLVGLDARITNTERKKKKEHRSDGNRVALRGITKKVSGTL